MSETLKIEDARKTAQRLLENEVELREAGDKAGAKTAFTQAVEALAKASSEDKK